MSDEPTTGSGAPTPDDAGDERLLEELRQLSAVLDPVPPEALAAARSAIAWRTMDAELAELTADLSAGAAPAGVRGGVAPALLSFEAGEFGIEVEVIGNQDERRLLGQVVPAGAGEVEVRHAGGRVVAAVDDLGRFSAAGVAAGPVSLRCRLGDRVVETDWFLA